MDEKKWYVVNTYSGHESKVKEKLEMRATSMNMEDKICRVIIPEQKVIEEKDGVKKEKIKKIFPGYIFIDMIVTDETWFMVRNTPMVTGFLGSSGGGSKPVPLLEEEINPILKKCGLLQEKPFECQVGEKVEIIGEAFYGSYGVITSIDNDKKIVHLDVDFFGRTTDVELEFSEVKKIQ